MFIKKYYPKRTHHLILIFLAIISSSTISTIRYENHNNSNNTFSQNSVETAKNGIVDTRNYGEYGDTIHVPAEQPTIQSGIDVAQTGDLVLVADGIYFENIVFKGVNITLASHFILDGDESHIRNTIIDGSQPTNPSEGSTVRFRIFEDTTTVLCGFTITGGTGTYQGYMCGGGIHIYLATPKIENNIIEGNIIDSPLGEMGAGICVFVDFASYPIIIKNNIIRNNVLENTGSYSYGGGIAIYANDFSPYLIRVYIENNIITNNQSLGNTFSYGGGVFVYGNGPAWWTTIRNNKIVQNSVALNSTQSYGGGISLRYTNSFVTNNLVIYNEAYESAGIYNDDNTHNNAYVNNTICFNRAIYDEGGIATDHSGEMVNCIVWNNQPNQFTTGSQVLDITYSLIGESYPGIGNINGNPSFLDTVNFLLDENLSPCIDAGNPDPQYYDIEDPNNPGYALYPALGTRINDIGHFGGPNASWILTEVENDPNNSFFPNDFLLFQNYPNPFNPSTTISYQIPQISFVRIKVYDVLGNEIATLVNEEKSVGCYELEFDANGLPSGIYFYKLQAGSSVETKKMVLMK